MKRYLPIALTMALFAVPAYGDEIVKPISQRFAATDVAETPDFQMHMVPLMGKLGCNGRACHGSFQGQGGFQLSLFGYDFKMDHENITNEDDSRIDLEDPAISMIIEKPTLEIPHEGGKRLDKDSWEYRVFLNWVKGGAKGLSAEQPAFERLELTPSEIVFQDKDETVQLKAVAVWSNGIREDVTPLCRFQSNNGTVAEINETGLVTSGEPGDTHMVVFYDGGVVPVPVMRPVSDKVGPKYPKVPTPSKVDELVVQKLRKLGIVPSELSSDEEFLRRVSIDMTGTLPSPAEIQAFVDDSSADKRVRKINELLESPAYAAWWTTRLCDFTGNSDDQLNNVVPTRGAASRDWYNWIYKRIEQNTPYDELAAGIILANSRDDGESYREFSATMSAVYQTGGRNKKAAAATDKPEFADRQYMPHFWARRNFRTAEERVISFAYSFMGIRIQCAQCHKHPFDQWTQDDFKEFTGFFTATTFGQNPETRDEYQAMLKELGIKNTRGNQARRELAKLLGEGKMVPFQELYTVQPRKASDNSNRNRRQNNNGRARPVPEAKLLGGAKIDLTQYDDPRKPLMDWLRDKNNGYFARAFVNRVWSGYFNVGIVSPADDLSLANPPSNRPLLDYLTAGFIENGFNMKWLHREIANSRTYQLSWKPNETNAGDETNFSHAVPRRMPAEVAYDALVQATAADEVHASMRNELDGRAISIPGASQRANRQNGQGYALTIFGRSTRDTNCDCDRSMESSLLQTVYLQNDRDVLTMIDRRNDGWLTQVAEELGTVNRAAVRNNDSNSRGPRKPANFDELVAKQRARIKSLRKQGKDKEADRMEARIKQYLKRFGAEEKVDDSPVAAAPAEKVASLDAEEIVRQVYLRTLSRLPNDEERDRSKQYIESSEDTLNGIRGLLWALLNTKEFIVNH